MANEKVTTEKIRERIEEVKAQIEKYNKSRSKYWNRQETTLEHISLVEYAERGGLSRGPSLDFVISNTGNISMTVLQRQLDKVLKPLSLKVRELRVFVPERRKQQNWLSCWAKLKWV
jgi:hypothetical protein